MIASVPLAPLPRRHLGKLVVTGLLLTSTYAACTMHLNRLAWPAAWHSFVANLRLMIAAPHLGQDSWATLAGALANTLMLAVLTTLIGAGIAFFLALLIAYAPRPVAAATSATMAVIRAVPTILWVMVYATAIGLGNEAAVVGLTCHSVAYLAKAFAEAMPPASLALVAGGSGFWVRVRHGLWPRLRASLLAWSFIRFEINFTNAVAVGAAAGTGGIGYNLFMASAFNFDFQEVGLIVYLLLAVAGSLELLAVKMRRRLN